MEQPRVEARVKGIIEADGLPSATVTATAS